MTGTTSPFAHACIWRYHGDTNTWSGPIGRQEASELDIVRRLRLPYFNGYTLITDLHDVGECDDHKPEPLVPVLGSEPLSVTSWEREDPLVKPWKPCPDCQEDRP